MKNFILICLCFLSTLAVAQKQDVEIYEKKEGDKAFVMARNIGKADYMIKLTITSQGMDVLPSEIVEALVPAGFMKEMATLSPRLGEVWSYSYNVTMTQQLAKSSPGQATTSKPVTPTSPITSSSNSVATSPSSKPALSNAEIILYAKPGCGRCDFVRKKLDGLNIQYLEIDTHSESPEVNNMWAQMRDQGFGGGSVTMPVVRVNGKYHYDIKDLDGFVSRLK